ncbi:MAG: DUF4197 domain-containing protein [Pseudomonadota bacterium]
MSDRTINRRMVLAALPASVVAGCTTAEQEAIFGAVLGSMGTTSTGTSAGGLTSAEAAQGIRAALDQGVAAAVSQVGRRDGYFADRQIKIPLPPRLAAAQSQLSAFGLSGMLDQMQLEINRGAEQAAPEARSIFVSAIRSMTINDAFGIVNGGPTSATTYFQNRTTSSLTRLFRPSIETALTRTGAIQTYDNILASLAGIPLAPQMGANARNDLIDHGVGKGLDGLFYYVAREEEAIRTNPAKRTSEILRRVFG